MTQEIGTVEAVEGLLDVSAYPIGSHLKIIPYHVSTISFFKSVSVAAPTPPPPSRKNVFRQGWVGMASLWLINVFQVPCSCASEEIVPFSFC